MRLAYEFAREYLATDVDGVRRLLCEEEIERLASMFMQYEAERAQLDSFTASTAIRSDYDETELLYDEA